MEKIRFINTSTVYDGEVSIYGKILSIRFTAPPAANVLTNGMEFLNEHNGTVQGDYTDYTTIYRTYEDNELRFEFSNDGSVYVPSVPVVTFHSSSGGTLDGALFQTVNNYDELSIPRPVADEHYEFAGWIPEIPTTGKIETDMIFRAKFIYIPTEEDLQTVFEYNRIAKITESRKMLAAFLEANPLKSTCHNNTEGTYTITSEKQTLMSNNYLTYMIAKQAGIPIELTWNETGKECEPWTEEEFLQLIMEVQAFVKPAVSLQQKYEVMINACKTQQELDAIVLTY